MTPVANVAAEAYREIHSNWAFALATLNSDTDVILEVLGWDHVPRMTELVDEISEGGRRARV